jgi:D-3-phosphoglycerate dehydrogenase / 2-oxoglutarate reductase
MSGHILYLGPSEALSAAREALEPKWSVIRANAEPEAVAKGLSSAVAVLDASMRVRFDRALLENAPSLLVISTASTGADHIDLPALTERRAQLLTLATERTVLLGLTPAAELSWGLLMACARQLRPAIQHVLDGKWVREEFPGIMLKGKTLGIIGCGRIGCWMARYAHAFDMTVMGYDPFIKPWPDDIAKNELDQLLSEADFISLHVPLNDQTRRLLGKREFTCMKRGAILVNTSRGAIADESALLEALESGHLAAAGLDVLEGEPQTQHHPLVEYARSHSNLIITPHIGGFSPDAVKIVVRHAARRIAEFLNDRVASAVLG